MFLKDGVNPILILTVLGVVNADARPVAPATTCPDLLLGGIAPRRWTCPLSKSDIAGAGGHPRLHR